MVCLCPLCLFPLTSSASLHSSGRLTSSKTSLIHKYNLYFSAEIPATGQFIRQKILEKLAAIIVWVEVRTSALYIMSIANML